MQRLEPLVKKFKGLKIGVLGDAVLDRFASGVVHRISPEAPVPVVSIIDEQDVPGGAANVTANIAALGGKAELVSAIGTDRAGAALLACIRRTGAETADIIRHSKRSTIQKVRIVGGGQHIVRIDYEMVQAIDIATERRLVRSIVRGMKSWSAVVVSDYAKGLVTPRLARMIVSLGRRHRIPVIVDTKPAHAAWFKGAFLFTPNSNEALAMAGSESVHAAGRILRKRLQAHILVTQGIEGMTLFAGGRPRHIPPRRHDVFDVVGAGDTVTAACALALAAGGALPEAAQIGNCAAGIVVRKPGTATVTAEELQEALSEIQ